ncbi:MAG: N-acetylmuramoyl-L-alanine amidase [Candidatus Nanopelagicales bacterium]|nr:N-acetylmuramoyl-L-alanine amidase [Candidatus Nanopelagicales bacterium]MDP4715092.1 N-acetylmuramoyl-L-alanine amidase [Candidatus Nanopelagicales bacterium]MDP4906873.1 N-acetylmuramoyl-L-alanine amidase [Candidatus Nanopelagicales bacterium]MDP4974399.1 N-acetylmuramoyl-L-alanine amidase [Candidatus Nanopelagicales bacterium]MDP5094879.1 N-acetylmuramoyl-L-alanine amidase [Candidatus Nanopelagicales bacterium]
MRRIGLVAATCVAVAGALALTPAAATPAPTAQRPLQGVIIALDPGHQLGNSNPRFASQLAKTKFNGLRIKGCNTTGTATNSGFPEATFNWRVTSYLENRLRALGATVRKTRSTNSYNAWGPCVWDRGRFGAQVDADLLLSIHADGAVSTGSGFYIMVPASIPGWTDDIAKSSGRMGQRFIQGMANAGAPRSTYIRDQTLVTQDISTLNFSDVPAILVELGNMRHPGDASRMTSREGQKQYADWVLAGIRAALRL